MSVDFIHEHHRERSLLFWAVSSEWKTEQQKMAVDVRCSIHQETGGFDYLSSIPETVERKGFSDGWTAKMIYLDEG